MNHNFYLWNLQHISDISVLHSCVFYLYTTTNAPFHERMNKWSRRVWNTRMMVFLSYQRWTLMIELQIYNFNEGCLLERVINMLNCTAHLCNPEGRPFSAGNLLQDAATETGLSVRFMLIQNYRCFLNFGCLATFVSVCILYVYLCRYCMSLCGCSEPFWVI